MSSKKITELKETIIDVLVENGIFKLTYISLILLEIFLYDRSTNKRFAIISVKSIEKHLYCGECDWREVSRPSLAG